MLASPHRACADTGFEQGGLHHHADTCIQAGGGESELRSCCVDDTHEWQFGGWWRAVLDVGLASGFSEAAEPVV